MPARTSLERDVPARGPLTAWVLARLAGSPGAPPAAIEHDDPLVGDDLHLALHLLLDRHFRPVPGWPDPGDDPVLDRFQRDLEDTFWQAARHDSAGSGGGLLAARARSSGAGPAVDRMLATFDGPSLSRLVEARGTRAQFEEFLIHRAAYQLKEADPHTLGLARLRPGPRKAAYAEIQFDEYGNGRPGEAHAELFAASMRAAGLDDTYGAQVPVLPGVTLATGNLLAIMATRPSLVGYLVGHLALFEMTSVQPMARYARAAVRLGFPEAVRRFYAVHVEADAHHGGLARRCLLGDDPAGDDLDHRHLVLGAHLLLRAEDRFARHLLGAWAAGMSSLVGGGASAPASSGGRPVGVLACPGAAAR